MIKKNWLSWLSAERKGVIARLERSLPDTFNGRIQTLTDPGIPSSGQPTPSCFHGLIAQRTYDQL